MRLFEDCYTNPSVITFTWPPPSPSLLRRCGLEGRDASARREPPLKGEDQHKKGEGAITPARQVLRPGWDRLYV